MIESGLRITFTVLLLSTAIGLGACRSGSYDDTEVVEQRVRAYLTDLRQVHDVEGFTRLRQHVHPDVRNADLGRVWKRVREQRYELIEITDIRLKHDRAMVTVRLRDNGGAVVTRKLLLYRDRGGWRLRDPELRKR